MSETTSDIFQPLVDRIFSPPISEFIHRLKLGKFWLDGFKINLLSLDAIFDDAELKAYENKQMKTWVEELSEVSYDVKEIIKQRLKAIEEKIEDLQTQGDALGLTQASQTIRGRFQQSVGRDEDESQVFGSDEDESQDFEAKSQVFGRDEDESRMIESGFICSRMGNDEYSEVSSKPWHLLISGGKDIAERSKEAKFLRTLILCKSSRGKESCQLSGEQLNNLFKALQCVRVLSLSGYDITKLPDSIGKLKRLRFLDLSHTAITQLSDSVSSLYNLQTLLLSNCSCLTELPYSLHNLRNLQYLDLSHTEITELPDSLHNLRNLQFLDHSHTAITEWPDSLHNLGNLQFLDLSHTAITELPDSLPKLRKLQLLDLSHTAITKLPAGVSSLYNLQKMLLSNCSCLTVFPDFKRNLLSLDAILDDAELKAYENKQVKTWLDELSEVSYDVKGLLDEISKKLPSFKTWFWVNFSAKLIPLEEIIKQRLIAITAKIKVLQGNAFGLREASQNIREPFQLSVGREDFENESQVFESGFICSRMRSDEYSEVSSKPWHLLISGGKDIAERSKEAKFLRTLILCKSSREKESCQLSGEQLNNLFEALQCVRVLSLSGYDIIKLPDSIGKLERLRFLDLSHTVITQLSDSRKLCREKPV
ncbi:hypothetical protein Q3G72_018702 [Acer saccharum]|nr:hypothetical protein Q3G72_018702 [Acer saccharum]